MLLEFSVSNFLSFRDKATLSMVASKDDSLPDNLVKAPVKYKMKVLKTAVIYGANASGKSNFLKAFRFFIDFVLSSHHSAERKENIPISPFKLDVKYTQKPSEFEIYFLHDGTKYQYGFSATSKKIYEEWLYSYPKKQPRLLFERKALPGKKDKLYLKFGTYWKGDRKRFENILHPKALLLSLAHQLGIAVASDLMLWFRDKVTWAKTNPIGQDEQIFTSAWAADQEIFRNELVKFLQKADFAISGLTINKVPFHKHHALRIVPKELLNNIIDDIKSKLPDGKELTTHETKFEHIGTDESGAEEPIYFDFNEESEGTQKLYALAGPIVHVLLNGCCLLVDELDTKLHPLLTREIIHLFTDPDLNINGAQLIFATHDSSLLDQKTLFRRDQIWFTERDGKGSSHLYSLWEFRPRTGENIRNGYLAGRYGAIPVIDSLFEKTPKQ